MTTFDVLPVGKPRMTQSDKWKQRKPVMNYWAYKDELLLKANILRYKPSDKELHIEFYLPMPSSWSESQKLRMESTIHQEKPDIDNLSKAFMDAFLIDDKKVWWLDAKKYWARKGSIIVY